MKIDLFNKRILETFHHNVYEICIDDLVIEKNELTAIEINKDNIIEAGSAVGRTTSKWIMNDYKYAKGYFFLNSNRENVGSCWVMFKGGDEKLYKIREHDSFIFRVQIEEQYRGQGYSKKILSKIFEIIKNNNCHNACLVCAVKNRKGNNLYNSMRMKIVDKKRFIRVFDNNIPYYTL